MPSTTPPNICPNPEDRVIYDYFDRTHFDLLYPADGKRVLRGSGDELVLPPNQPQEIVITSENVVFMSMSLTVRYARTVALTLTMSNLQTVNAERPVAADAVSGFPTATACAQFSDSFVPQDSFFVTIFPVVISWYFCT